MTDARRVHFASGNSYYSPAPSTLRTLSTPSPVYSDTSFPSEDERLVTPPQTTVSLPGQMIRLHRALYAGSGYTTALAYDVTQDPNTVRVLPNATLSSSLATLLTEPATNPPVASMMITSALLPYKINATPRSTGHPYHTYPASKHDHTSCVTVGDVLFALYETLRKPLSESELATAPAAVRAYAVDTYRARAGRVGHTAGGMRRADLLGQHTAFEGLSIAGSEWSVALGTRR